MSDLILSFDGGSRGNPGPAACAWVLKDITGAEDPKGTVSILHQDATVKDSQGYFMGHATNNEAEYNGLVKGLEKVYELSKNVNNKINKLYVLGDSELVINQVLGIYRVNAKNLKDYHEKATTLITRLELDMKIELIIRHVRRELNGEADAIVNEVLDKELSKKATKDKKESEELSKELLKKSEGSKKELSKKELIQKSVEEQAVDNMIEKIEGLNDMSQFPSLVNQLKDLVIKERNAKKAYREKALKDDREKLEKILGRKLNNE
jgi:ribonuclease HI